MARCRVDAPGWQRGWLLCLSPCAWALPRVRMRGSGRVLDRQPKYRGKRVCRCDRGEFTSGAAAAAHRARVGTHTRDAPRPGRLVRQSRGVAAGHVLVRSGKTLKRVSVVWARAGRTAASVASDALILSRVPLATRVYLLWCCCQDGARPCVPCGPGAAAMRLCLCLHRQRQRTSCSQSSLCPCVR